MSRWFFLLLFGACVLLAHPVYAKDPTPRTPTPRLMSQGPFLVVKVRGFVSVRKRWSRALRQEALRDGLQKAVKQVLKNWVEPAKWDVLKSKLSALWSSRNAPLFIGGYQVMSERRVGTLYSAQLKVFLLKKKLRQQFDKLQQSTP